MVGRTVGDEREGMYGELRVMSFEKGESPEYNELQYVLK